MDYSFAANVLAFVVLIGSAVYDYFFAKQNYDKRIDNGMRPLESFRIGQKHRALLSYAVLFLLSLSMLLTMAPDWRSKMSDEPNKIESRVEGIDSRLRRIEDFLWPPTEGGDAPIDPTGGPGGPPYGPASLKDLIEALENKLDDAIARSGEFDEGQDEIFRTLSELKDEVEAYKKTAKALEEALMAAPAQ